MLGMKKCILAILIRSVYVLRLKRNTRVNGFSHTICTSYLSSSVFDWLLNPRVYICEMSAEIDKHYMSNDYLCFEKIGNSSRVYGFTDV